MSTLHHAASKGDVELVEKLLDGGEDINGEFDENDYLKGIRPLHAAAYFNQIETVQLLLERGAVPNATDAYGQTALHMACRKGLYAITEMLLQAGADPDMREGRYGDTPLLLGTRRGQESVIILLLIYHADPNIKDNQNVSPLHAAAKYGHKQITERLIAAAGDINACDKEGRMPLDWARNSAQREVMEILVQRGAMKKPKDVMHKGCLIMLVGLTLFAFASSALAVSVLMD